MLERPNDRSSQHHHADRYAFAQERHAQCRAVSTTSLRLEERIFLVREDIRDMNRLPLKNGSRRNCSSSRLDWLLSKVVDPFRNGPAASSESEYVAIAQVDE